MLGHQSLYLFPLHQWLSMVTRSRPEVLRMLSDAVESLAGSLSPELIPAGGANIAYGLPGARSGADVAAVRGGIVTAAGIPRVSGEVAFDTSEPVVGIVLAASRFDPHVLSAGTIRFSEGALGAAEDMFLETCSFDREREPPGGGVMDWGVASCCRDGVPDLIYDRGGPGKEALIRILDIAPGEVANKIIMLQKRILQDR